MDTRSLNTEVAGFIAERRKALGITQAEMAEQISVEKETISRMENGKIVLSLDRLEQFALILKCSPADLLRPPATGTQDLVESLLDAIHPLSEEEQQVLLKFVREASLLFRSLHRKPSESISEGGS